MLVFTGEKTEETAGFVKEPAQQEPAVVEQAHAVAVQAADDGAAAVRAEAAGGHAGQADAADVGQARRGFALRRKTLVNSLQTGWQLPKEQLAAIVAGCGAGKTRTGQHR